ncbi:arsenate reductase ArsC [Rhodoluna sp. KAS3]|uniref:arsenate reductase ArsC n=1 Tax=Rhodoluna sp. KAS3 TaxID=942880 RepID=UPI00222FEB2D|nr:arsenate reductase ArsC [Rhodoluna sp. KAS3]BDS49541.1 arsenate reductase [Rhodoluna sp. KAS3]
MSDKKASVLFVCVHNAGRSQMAAGYLQALAGDRVEVRSAGTAPKNEVNPSAVAAMLEEGIDISTNTPKVLSDEAVKASDYVITMGCGDTCPFFPGKTYLDWVLDDPAGQGVEAVRPIRDKIRAHIEELIAEIDQKF